MQAALAAVAQQLVEEHPGPGRYRWRHALTQEAIYAEIVTPRRQAIHSCAAEVLAQPRRTRPVDLANHLLGAARFDEAVPLPPERRGGGAMPRLRRGDLDAGAGPAPRERSEREGAVLCRIGQDHWLNGEPATGAATEVGIEALEELGESWRRPVPDRAGPVPVGVHDRMRPGPSTSAPSTCSRPWGRRPTWRWPICGSPAWTPSSSTTGLPRVAQRGGDRRTGGRRFERVWALGFVALGYVDGDEQERGLALMDACFREAREKGYSQIARTWRGTRSGRAPT